MKIVVFSGAGMSAESGISTFRDNGGLWENVMIEDVATPDAWKKDPFKVQTFYNDRRKQIIKAEPNEAHLAIRELEKQHEVIVITQNIDDLHERAGSSEVLHLHGNIRYSKSSGPNQEKKYYPIDGWELTLDDLCPEGYILRPHVVWFGEAVPMMEVAVNEIRSADCLIVIGTSLQVYPAAGLVFATAPDCIKIIIDPFIDPGTLPPNFISIKETATVGIEKCLTLLKQKSDS